MSMKITECPKCHYNKEFPILNPKVMESSSVIVEIQTQCPECNTDFTYPGLSNICNERRRRGQILV